MDREAGIDSIYDSLERIRRAQRRRRNALEQAERSGVFLSPLSLSILAELHRHGPTRIQVLTERADAELPRVSREVHLLEESGHVSIEPDPRDKRVRIVRPTEEGTTQWRAFQAAGHEMLHERLGAWNEGDITELATLLGRFLERDRSS